MTGRAAVVTGASSGIGRACALHLARRNLSIFAGARSTRDAENLGRDSSGRLVPVLIDVTDQESVAAAVEAVAFRTRGKGLAGLVNNAGIAIPSPLESIPIA